MTGSSTSKGRPLSTRRQVAKVPTPTLRPGHSMQRRASRVSLRPRANPRRCHQQQRLLRPRHPQRLPPRRLQQPQPHQPPQPHQRRRLHRRRHRPRPHPRPRQQRPLPARLSRFISWAAVRRSPSPPLAPPSCGHRQTLVSMSISIMGRSRESSSNPTGTRPASMRGGPLAPNTRSVRTPTSEPPRQDSGSNVFGRCFEQRGTVLEFHAPNEVHLSNCGVCSLIAFRSACAPRSASRRFRLG